MAQWNDCGFNVEDYTWEKEADVIGNGDDDGANELVEEYWNRVAYLESRPSEHCDYDTPRGRVVDEVGAASNGVFIAVACVCLPSCSYTPALGTR